MDFDSVCGEGGATLATGTSGKGLFGAVDFDSGGEDGAMLATGSSGKGLFGAGLRSGLVGCFSGVVGCFSGSGLVSTG